LINILTEPRWLGGANFGGDESALSPLKAHATGTFFVPPCRPGDVFPGESHFGKPRKELEEFALERMAAGGSEGAGD
jgi:hypothetical protein